MDFRPQIDEINHILQAWMESLSYGSEETLFLLEWNGFEISTAEDRRLFEELFPSRGDTLCFIKNFTDRELPESNLKFKYSDRRTDTLKDFVLFDRMMLKIINDLLSGKELERIQAELLEMRTRQNVISIGQTLECIREYADIEAKFCVDTSRRDEFFLSKFPHIREISHCLDSTSEEPSHLAREFLDDLVKVIPELEECRRGFAGDTAQHRRLACFLDIITKTREAVEAFFDTYFPDRTQPYCTAFLNSMERTRSFQPYIDLNDPYKRACINYTIRNTTADAGFYMDILNAIRSGARRVVLYAGANHTLMLRIYLAEAYGESAITDQVGSTEYESELIGNTLLPPAELRRILGMR